MSGLNARGRFALSVGLLAALAAAGCNCSDESLLDGSVSDGGDAATEDTGSMMAACGDGRRDTGEVCDDGNTDDGDGCSADCSSDESCGNGFRDLITGELCDDGNTDDGDTCRGDCGSDYQCGNGVTDPETSEVCDDGNTANGDGCSAACDSDESCGNNIVDLGAGEVCDDGNTAGGDACSADCSMSTLCGNGMLDGVEECDDGGTTPGDGCNASCQIERCGNGRIDASESCDDGNADDTDGCTVDCAFTCSSNTDCADADVCNGDEVCNNPGTDTSSCSAGTPLADGDLCGSGLICDGGACVTAACGDGFTTAPEQCDDMNTAGGDGCEADCTFTCSADAECDDTNACNGTETCSNAGTATSACNNGTPPAAGTSCGTGLICRGQMCVAEACGDGLTTGTEQCDDMNTINGDGCDNDCTFTCSGSSDCADTNPCNGAETCSMPSTPSSMCIAGTPLMDGASCGGTNICRGGNCVAAGCGDGIRSGSEQCDDGNMTSGDGCDSDCTWTCAGNADCADTNVCNGAETCTMPSTLGSRCVAGTPMMNGTMCGTGLICNAGACVMARCGDGIRSGTEQCDDMNAVNGDGCDTDCTWTCASNADCADTNTCNGAETCTMPSTIGSRCNAGTPPAPGTPCGATGTNICIGGACVAPRCGDGVRSGTEQCDDMNTTNGDGCDNDCTWTCSSNADCVDTNTCNGAETCTMPNTIGSRCNPGAPPATGTLCDRDMNAATRDICIMSMMSCNRSICGDTYIDTGATPAEQCDDGNAMSGDGCSSTCQTEMAVPPTAFRTRTLRLISPRITVAVPLAGCQDITDNCASLFGSCQADSVNTQLANALNPTTTPGGTYSLHIVSLFRPLNPAAATTPTELHLNAACMQGPPETCGPDPMPDVTLATAMNQSAGTCYMPIAAEVNTRAGTPLMYTPTANTVTGPCFRTNLPSLTVDIGGIIIPLTEVTVAATYSGSPPNQLVSGILTGFLTEQAATTVLLPATIPLVGGDPLYEHLQAGNRTVSGVADGCNVGGNTSEDDADFDSMGRRGFRFFMNFTSNVVPWTGP